MDEAFTYGRSGLLGLVFVPFVYTRSGRTYTWPTAPLATWLLGALLTLRAERAARAIFAAVMEVR